MLKSDFWGCFWVLGLMKHLQLGCKSVCLSAVPYGGGFLIGLVLLDCSSRTKWRLLSSSYLPCLTSGRLLAQTIDKLVLPLLPLSHVLGMVLFCNDQKLRHLLLMGSEKSRGMLCRGGFDAASLASAPICHCHAAHWLANGGLLWLSPSHWRWLMLCACVWAHEMRQTDCKVL